MQPLLAVLAAAGAMTYPLLEARWFRIKHLAVKLERDVPGLTVLHISDMHLAAGDKALLRFLDALPGKIAQPDLVIATGDLIDDDTGIAPVVRVLNNLPARHGRFYVLGSHDYYQSRFQSYLKYFGDRAYATKAPVADTQALEEGLQDAGWVCLTNTTECIDLNGGRVRVSGVDDPYLDRHETGHIERSRDDVLAIGVTHAPDVVSEWFLDGFDIVLAGHTHAGQVRVPGVGALVTNSSLPSALSGGLHRLGRGWLHVSPGLGTGRFAPIRFNCRPEVTVLTIS